jgi:hypothetical protein
MLKTVSAAAMLSLGAIVLLIAPPRAAAIELTANARSYSGTVKSAVTMMGKTTTTDKKVEGKWVAAACKKK